MRNMTAECYGSMARAELRELRMRGSGTGYETPGAVVNPSRAI